MGNKYQKKPTPPEDLQTYKEICIRCGKKQLKTWPKSLPIPNMTDYMGQPSWFQCLMGQHYFYSEQELVEVKN